MAGTQGRYGALEAVTPEELRELPIVLREKGSGTREIIERALSRCGLSIGDLNVVIELSSTEAIKSFVRSSDTLAIVSVIALHRELADGSLRIVGSSSARLRSKLLYLGFNQFSRQPFICIQEIVQFFNHICRGDDSFFNKQIHYPKNARYEDAFIHRMVS